MRSINFATARMWPHCVESHCRSYKSVVGTWLLVFGFVWRLEAAWLKDKMGLAAKYYRLNTSTGKSGVPEDSRDYDGSKENNSSPICALKDLHARETQESGERAGVYPALSGGGTGRYAVDSRHGRQDSASGADLREVRNEIG